MFYKGRKDQQIKYKGYRIELGEIETALQSLAPVEHAVVIPVLNADGAISRLTAAVTVNQSCTGKSILQALFPLAAAVYVAPQRAYFREHAHQCKRQMR